jgi:hypothetical protein
MFVLHGRLCQEKSLTYVCPECGEAWALLPVEGSKFSTELGLCHRHARDASTISGLIPGSLLRPWSQKLFQSLPNEVLRREFLLHLDYAESQLCQM